MSRNEAETRTDLIDPALVASGWTKAHVDREYMYRPGRLRLLGETTVRDDPQYVDYVLRDSDHGFVLAVVEAKDESHSAGAGLQQALAYATDVAAPFAFSSNGHDIVEQDLRTRQVRHLKAFPTPDELRERWRQEEPVGGPIVVAPHGARVPNPLLEPTLSVPGSLPVRYYQERAVSAAIREMVSGRSRCLLTLATGTGKTFIAFSIAYKLLKAGWARKVLFLADRVSLRDQSYNEFWAFGDRRGVVNDARGLPLHRDVHFAIYQGMYADVPGTDTKVYEAYPRDYFDVVIVDECHRSGYGDWAAILDHFNSAFRLGLTATPKRSDSVDTYAAFGSEQPDADGNPAAVYEYSLGQGMEDGFLATYKVLAVQTNLDADGLHVSAEVDRGAELIVPEGAEAADWYRMSQFERDIVVPDRTRVLCEHLAGVLRRTGPNAKTMIFCVTMEHADLVRQEMQRLLGSETGKNLYAARIVSEERDASALLEQFQDSSGSEPVVVTTVDLLTTGVNAPAVRNIVFMKPVDSTTVFKQIIGRGSRLDTTTNKTFFRIIDYTMATRLLDEWDIPPATPIDEPHEGDGVLAGFVVDDETNEPVAASLTVRLNRRLLKESASDDNGEFTISELPATTVDLYATAPGYTRRALRVDTTMHTEVLISLVRPRASQKIRISGVDVHIGSEVDVDLGDGRDLSTEEYIDRARAVLDEVIGTADALRDSWLDFAKRRALLERLTARQVTSELLQVVMRRMDADEYDLYRHVLTGHDIPTREQRAAAARTTLGQRHPTIDPQFLDDLVDKYRLAGPGEVTSAEVFGLPPFATTWGGLTRIVAEVGGPAQVTSLLISLTSALYTTEFDE